MIRSDTLFSVVIPVCRRVDDIAALVNDYSGALTIANLEFEIIVVLDGRKEDQLERLRPVADSNERVRIIQFARQFGESAALMAGFEMARGEMIMTLPAYYQVDPPELAAMATSIDDEVDMVVAVRAPRVGSAFEKIRRRVFHGMLKLVTGLSYRDLGCGVRLMRKQVSDEINLYGDHYVFLPVLAVQRGFTVQEIELAQSKNDRLRGGYNLRQHLHGLLNMMTVFFLHRFTKKPLRFFGSIGFLAAAFGGLVVVTLVVQRLFFGVALADRPALLLGSLLIVLGVQLFALGLLGELVIFSHAAESKEYAIRAIIEQDSASSDGAGDQVAEARDFAVHR